MRKHEHMGLTCDHHMGENDAGIPKELKRCDKTRNVQRHVRFKLIRSVWIAQPLSNGTALRIWPSWRKQPLFHNFVRNL